MTRPYNDKRSVTLTQEEIDQYNNQVTLAVLAANRGVSIKAITSALKRQNIPKRKATRIVSSKHLYNVPVDSIQKYLDGMSLLELTALLNVSRKTLRDALKRQGVQLRTIKEATQLLSKKHSARLQGISEDDWKEYASTKQQRIYTSQEYKEWRLAVYKRDKFTCRMCDYKGQSINAHHIYPKSKYPERTFDVTNGITLCVNCHYQTYQCEEEFIDRFIQEIGKDY